MKRSNRACAYERPEANPLIRPARAVALLVAVLIASPLVIASPEAEPEAAACAPGLREMEDVGLVCPQPDGLFQVFSPDLESLGFIHGSDPIPEPEPEGIGALAGTSPFCVSGAAGTYFIQVIYARATNDVDGYATWAPQIRYMVGQANKLVDDAGIATGGPASLKVKCIGATVEVKNEVLPTAMASASFSTIVTDLRNKGYNDGKVKYWVFYDDTSACSCGGQGNVYNDDSPGVTNNNNGNANSMFAVNYGYNSTRIWLHELGHNLGAVQNSAARSTLAFHCYDGRDTMCYNDGGPNGSLYSTSYCATEVWDCGRNDYFHANPAPGSYLATHWNIGNPVNRFIAFGIPTLTSLVCPTSVETDQLVSCTFVASDDSSGVRYTVNWGDGTTTTVPTSGFVTPGVTQSATKTYTTAGTRSVSVSVIDNAGFAGNTLAVNVGVVADPPVMNLLTCTSPVELGAATTCNMRATDLSSGVKYTVAWGDGTTTIVPSSGTVAPGVTQTATKTYASNGTRTVSVTATDLYNHVSAPRTTSVNVVWDLTAPSLTVTDPKASTIYVGCGTTAPTNPISSPRGVWVETACVKATATDARSGVNRVEVRVNGVLRATDTTAPYTIEFPVPNTATSAAVQVRAIDNAGNIRNADLLVDMVAA